MRRDIKRGVKTILLGSGLWACLLAGAGDVAVAGDTHTPSLRQVRAAAQHAAADYRRAELRVSAARHAVCQSRNPAHAGELGGLFVLAERAERTGQRSRRAHHRLRDLRRRLNAIVATARRYLGVPYVWGGASPGGFDCSGFTMYVLGKFGVRLWHGATAQQHALRYVGTGSLQRGDLVFFGGPSRSYHVGLYVGGGRMIHAPHTGDVVRYGSVSGAWAGGRP